MLCVACLIETGAPTPAVTVLHGAAVCGNHLKQYPEVSDHERQNIIAGLARHTG